MLIIEGFNGFRVEIPEDRYYLSGTDLWIQPQNESKALVFGLTHAGIILTGGVVSLEYLIEEGQVVSSGDTVAFAVTSKIKFIETPLAGIILNVNRTLIDNPSFFQEDPYGKAWIFSLQLPGPVNLSTYFSDAASYQQRLLHSEACGNPKGLKGGVSPTCRTIYSSFRTQKQG